MNTLSFSSRKLAALWKRTELQVGANTTPLITVFLFLLAGWLAWNAGETINHILHFYDPLPVWDYWREPYYLANLKTFGARFLWQPHNEHRIVFQEIAFLLDMLLFRGRMILPIAVSCACYFATGLLLTLSIFADKRLSLVVKWTATLLAGILMAWKGCAIDLAVPFLLQWTLLLLAMASSLTFLSRIREAESGWWLMGAIAAVVVGTYCSLNGLVLGPLVLAVAVLLRLGPREIVALSATAILCDGLYFLGYHVPTHFRSDSIFLHPLYGVEFVAAYLGMPFGGMKSPQFGVYVGFANLVLGAGLVVVASRLRLLLSRTGIVLFGSYTFILITAILTAAGRMQIQDKELAGAKASRFLLVSLTNWAVLILLGLWLSSRTNWRRITTPVTAFVIVVLLGVSLPKLRWWLRYQEDTFNSAQMASLSIKNGLSDSLMLRKVFPDPEFVRPLLSYLREHQLSVFAGDDRSEWLGQPVSVLGKRAASPASGAVSYTFPLESGLQVVGWLDQSDRHHPPEWLVFANEAGQIAGFGRKLPAGFPAHLRSPTTAYSQGWVGFVDSRIKSNTYTAYVMDRGTLIPIVGSFSAPDFTAARFSETGAPISGVQWQLDNTWTLNGISSEVELGAAPAGRIYGSWSGSDANTGQAVASFSNPPSGCFILPVVAGPIVGAQSVEISDADTGRVLERVPMQEGMSRWELWRFSIPPAVKHLRITARDEGKSWGQWLAISDPASCK